MSTAQKVCVALQEYMEDAANWSVTPPPPDKIRTPYDNINNRNAKYTPGVYISPGMANVQTWYGGKERYIHQYVEIWVKGYDYAQRDEWAGDIRRMLGGLVLPGFVMVTIKSINQFDADPDEHRRWACTMEYQVRFVES